MAEDFIEEFNIDDMRRGELASWVHNEVERAHEDWEREYKGRYDDYYRIWRGRFAEDGRDNTEVRNKALTKRDTRSKLIHPQLQAAIDSTHAEVVSATAHAKTYFKLDDTEIQNPEAVQLIESNLHSDFELAKIKKGIIDLTLIGTLFGTGVAKIQLRSHDQLRNTQDANGDLRLVKQPRPLVDFRVMLPHEVVVDSVASCLDDAKFVATYEDVPRHTVLKLQKEGVYLPVEISPEPNRRERISGEEEPWSNNLNNVHRIEYHGLVPRQLLEGSDIELELDEEDPNMEPRLPDIDEDDLVEAFVVVINKTTVVMAKENPLVNQDRLFLAYRHEVVPGQFWGRGVAEKGYSPHKALSANLRARQDALPFMTNPMYEYDAQRLPRNFKFEVTPGRNFPVIGSGGQSIRRVDMGQITPDQFDNTSELQQMVQIGTGAVDQQPQNTTGAQNGFNLQALNFVKRSQIAIANFSEEFMVPFVELATRIYMQFMPQRYPAVDVTFKAAAALGTLAKELEQAQLINLLKTMQAGPAQLAILHSVVMNSSVEQRDAVGQIIAQELQVALNPPPPQPTPLEQMQIQQIQAQIGAEQARRVTDAIRSQAEVLRAANDAVKADSDEAQKITQAILNLANAQAAATSSIQELGTTVDAIADAEAAENNAQLTNDTIKRAQEAGIGDIIGLVQGSGITPIQ